LLQKPRAVDVSSNYQFEEEIGAASSVNGLFPRAVRGVVEKIFYTRLRGALDFSWRV
jgi:hypothetical protein